MAPSKISRPKAAEPEAEHNQGSKYPETTAKRKGKSKEKTSESILSKLKPPKQQNDNPDANFLHQGHRFCAHHRGRIKN